MSKAYRCDRCGKYYHDLSEANKIEIIGRWDPAVDSFTYDLCNDCRNALEEFLGVTHHEEIEEECTDVEELGDTELDLDYGAASEDDTDTGNEIVCKSCMGRGLIPIGPEIRGLMECPVCNGHGRLMKK